MAELYRFYMTSRFKAKFLSKNLVVYCDVFSTKTRASLSMFREVLEQAWKI